MKKLIDLIILRKNGETVCSCCKTPCQGFKDPRGESFVMTVIKRFGEQHLNKRSDKNGCTRKFKVS